MHCLPRCQRWLARLAPILIHVVVGSTLMSEFSVDALLQKHNLFQEHFYPWGKEKRGTMNTYHHIVDVPGISECCTSVFVTGFGDDSPPALFAETFQTDPVCL